MITELVLKIIFILNIGIVLYVLFKSYKDTIKSKNYRNIKKLFVIQLIMFVAIYINIFFLVELGGEVFRSGLEDAILLFALYIPLIILIVINILVLLLVMKKEKYNSTNTVCFRKYIVIMLTGLTITWGTIYLYANIIIRVNAKVYYEKKYNQKIKIVATETIIDDENSFGRDSKTGIVFVLDNNQKVFYDFYYKKYYDNKQSDEIKNLITSYYEESLQNLRNEFKKENQEFEYLFNPGDKKIEEPELYSHIINANQYDEYKYYSHDEFYFNKYYHIDIHNKEKSIENIFDSGEVFLSAGITVNILCDRNGNWKQMMDEFVSNFNLDVTFILYDISSVKEHVLKTNCLKYSDESFAQYYFKDGQYVLKK